MAATRSIIACCPIGRKFFGKQIRPLFEFGLPGKPSAFYADLITKETMAGLWSSLGSPAKAMWKREIVDEFPRKRVPLELEIPAGESLIIPYLKSVPNRPWFIEGGNSLHVVDAGTYWGFSSSLAPDREGEEFYSSKKLVEVCPKLTSEPLKIRSIKVDTRFSGLKQLKASLQMLDSINTLVELEVVFAIMGCTTVHFGAVANLELAASLSQNPLVYDNVYINIYRNGRHSGSLEIYVLLAKIPGYSPVMTRGQHSLEKLINILAWKKIPGYDWLRVYSPDTAAEKNNHIEIVEKFGLLPEPRLL